MSSSRKALQTLQMAPKKNLSSVNEKDEHVKLQFKVNSDKCDPEQPSRTALSKHKENVEAKLSGKEKASNNNQINLAEDIKKTAVKNTSECDEIIEKLTSTSDHDNSFDAISWMTAKEPAENYWKELALQRGNALEESLLENENLYEAVNVLNTKIESLNKKVEIQNEIISTQKETLETRAVEIERLREISAEVERLRSVLEELTEGIDE